LLAIFLAIEARPRFSSLRKSGESKIFRILPPPPAEKEVMRAFPLAKVVMSKNLEKRNRKIYTLLKSLKEMDIIRPKVNFVSNGGPVTRYVVNDVDAKDKVNDNDVKVHDVDDKPTFVTPMRTPETTTLAPKGANPAPTGTNPVTSGANQAPKGANPDPSGANPAPTGANLDPSGANPAPTGANPAPTGANPAPTGPNPSPTGANPAPTGAHPAPTGAGTQDLLLVSPPLTSQTLNHPPQNPGDLSGDKNFESSSSSANNGEESENEIDIETEKQVLPPTPGTPDQNNNGCRNPSKDVTFIMPSPQNNFGQTSKKPNGLAPHNNLLPNHNMFPNNSVYPIAGTQLHSPHSTVTYPASTVPMYPGTAPVYWKYVPVRTRYPSWMYFSPIYPIKPYFYIP